MQASPLVGYGVRQFAAAFLSIAFAVAAFAPRVPVAVASVDPQLLATESSMVLVAPGQAEAVARFARGAGAGDVTVLGALDMVTARLDARAARALAANVAVREIASDGEVVAADSGDDREEVDKAEREDSRALRDHAQRAKEQGEADAPDRTAPLRESPTSATTSARHEDKEGRRSAFATAKVPRGISTSSGFTTVAVVDGGVAEQAELDGKVLVRVDFVRDGTTSFDPGGHGTFIAGLIVGTSTGVDPGAKIVSLRVLNAQGVGRIRDVLGAFDWLLRNRFAYGVRVVNISWGARQTTSYHRDVLAAAAESLWFSGMVVVAAAGNAGPNAGTIKMPGADPFVVTIGSLSAKSSGPSANDRDSEWSSRGPTLDGFLKPDLLAPGENLVSLRVPGSFLDLTFPDRNVKDAPGYTRMSGTSVATAIASGVAALVVGSHPRRTPTQVKTVLVTSGRKLVASSTPAIDGAFAVASEPPGEHSNRANAGLRPSALLLATLGSQLTAANVSWENVSWENVSWDNVTWENVSWENVTWDQVTREAVSWEALEQ